jgi:hypothetical protein
MYLSANHDVRELLVIALILIFGSPTARGQEEARPNRDARQDVLTVVNPNRIDMPGERARVLLVTACRVLADEFHRKPVHVERMMTLVLGARDEHYSIDKDGRMTIYLEHWDEGKFVNGVITSVVERMAPLRLRNQMFTEILRRTEQIAPVSAYQLQKPGGNSSLPTGDYPTCTSEVATRPCSALNRPRRP